MTSLVTMPAGKGAHPLDAYSDHFVPQRYEQYDASAHDVWREVVERNERLVRTHRHRVHPAYAQGLDALRLPRRIPRLEDLNERLQGTGWSIVAVDGYIPTSAYVGLMAQSVFPVSRAIRRPIHIDFAPAPDLVHDVLGHLPLLFSREHRDFLKRLAGVMGRAASNELDARFFDAARRLADVMSDPARCTREGPVVEERMRSVNAALESNASELTHLRRMYVWSIEFGLLGDPTDYRVHGAALLSSPAEFVIACGPGAPVVPYSLDVIHRENAFSEPVAQYFVARDIRQLTETLVSYECGMSHTPPEDMLEPEASRLDREEGRSDHA
jgi:phenylalanine-4-hydroxylase